MLRTSLAACLIGFAFASAAHATLTDTIAQVNASAFELDEAGYTRVGVGPFVSGPSGECSVNGCFDLIGASGVLPNKGYFEFQFNKLYFIQ